MREDKRVISGQPAYPYSVLYFALLITYDWGIPALRLAVLRMA